MGSLTGDEVARIYRAADAFVCASVSEVMPLTVLEAMASGVPTVVHHDPGYDHWRGDLSGVLLADLSDGSLRERLGELRGDPERCGAGSAAARQTALAYSWDKHVDALFAVHDDALLTADGVRAEARCD